MAEYDIVDHTIAREDEKLWKGFLQTTIDENWTLDKYFHDHAHEYSRVRGVFARSKTDGSHISSVVWIEHDDENVAWLATYITDPAHRGKGIGSVMWAEAMKRIPKSSKLGLFAVGDDIAAKYRTAWTPFLESTQMEYEFDHRIVETARALTSDIQLEARYTLDKGMEQEILQMDAEVTGRDRTEFLSSFLRSDGVLPCLAYDGNIFVGYGAAIPIPHRHGDKVYRIAPIFAHSTRVAAFILQHLTQTIISNVPTARFNVSTIIGSASEVFANLLIEKTPPVVRKLQCLRASAATTPVVEKTGSTSIST